MLPKTTNKSVFILKKATAVLAETTDDFQHSTFLAAESRSFAIRFLSYTVMFAGRSPSFVPWLQT